MSDKHFDYFVIGAGSGGVRSARIAAQHGAKVGIAEASKLGGTCVNLGCVPKKLFAYGADYGYHFEDARGYGWDVPKSVPFSWKKLIANKNAEIDRLNDIYKFHTVSAHQVTSRANAGVLPYHNLIMAFRNVWRLTYARPRDGP